MSDTVEDRINMVIDVIGKSRRQFYPSNLPSRIGLKSMSSNKIKFSTRQISAF